APRVRLAAEVELRGIHVGELRETAVVAPGGRLRVDTAPCEQPAERDVVENGVIPRLLPLDHELDEVPAEEVPGPAREGDAVVRTHDAAVEAAVPGVVERKVAEVR